MQPSRQKRQWHAQWQSRPGSSTDHRETQRRFHGSYLRHEDQDHDAWPSRSTSPRQQRRHTNLSPTPAWRDRFNRPESQAQAGHRWIPPEGEEHSQRREPPVRRWRSPEPTLRLRRSEFDGNSDSRSWPQRHQHPHPLLAPRSLNVSRLGDGNPPGPVVYERRNSEDCQDARSTQPRWADDDDAGDEYGDEYDDDDEGDEEDSDEQNNSTLKYRYSPPARSFKRWQNFRADHRLQRTESPIRVSHDDHVGVLHN
jgi:hypothetical protein